MKRCPLCDFIYEDDQSLCDMDGIELVPDGGALPVAPAAAAPGAAEAAKPSRRRFSLPLLFGGVLAAALLSAYFISSGESAPRETPAAPIVASPTPPPASPTTPAASPIQPPAAPPAAAAVAEPAPPADGDATPSRPSPTPARPRAAHTKARPTPPAERDRKRQSKVGSILSKTGRILKKPFRF